MTASAAMEFRSRQASVGNLVELFKALSTRLGGATGALEEEAIQHLVDLARDGDRVAAQRLYRQYVDRVYRTVRGMLNSDADAEDVTQDTMLKVLTSLHRYSPRSNARFATWVTTIAVNTARRRFRRRRPEPTETGELFDVPDEAVDPERDVDAARTRAVLLDALAALGPTERDIVSLRYGAELDAREIAAVVGLEHANVRKILARARARLRGRIESVFGDQGYVS